MVKKLTALLLAAALVGGVLSGCGEDAVVSEPTASMPAAQSGAQIPQTPVEQDGADLSISIGPEPLSLDPALSGCADTDAYCNAVFEGLYKRDAQGEVVLGQAETASVSKDGLTWTFQLRQDAKWSDGQPVQAEDFVYAWQRNCMLEDAPERQLFAYLKNGAALLAGSLQDATQLGVRAVDSHTLEVTLAAPCSFLSTLLLRPIFMPLRRDAVEKDKNWDRNTSTYLTNGPLQLKSWSHKESLVFVRNDTYYDASEVTTRQVTCLLSEDDAARLTSYDASELSYITPLPANDSNMRKRGDFLLQNQQTVACLQFATGSGPLTDSRVRRALSLAIDRDTLAVSQTSMRYTALEALVPAGFSDAAQGSDFRTAGGSYFSAKADDYVTNLTEANRLLDEAGYQDRSKLGTLTITNVTDTLAETMSNAIAAMWQDKLGITCKVEKKSNKDYQSAVQAGKVQVTFTVLRADYDNAAALLMDFSQYSGANVAGFQDAQYESLLEQARTAPDTKTQYAALHKAEQYLMEQMPVAPLFVAPHTALATATTTGVAVSPSGVLSLAYLQSGAL